MNTFLEINSVAYADRRKSVNKVNDRLCVATILEDGSAKFLSYWDEVIRTYERGNLDARIGKCPQLPMADSDSLVEAIRPLVGKSVLMTVGQARQLFRVRLGDFDTGC